MPFPNRYELIILLHCPIILFFNSHELHLLFPHLHPIILKIFRLGVLSLVPHETLFCLSVEGSEDSDPLHVFGLSLNTWEPQLLQQRNCRDMAFAVYCCRFLG